MKSRQLTYGNGKVQVIDIDLNGDLKPNELLLKVNSSAICGSDLFYLNNSPSSESNDNEVLHLGHEWVGQAIELGSNVEKSYLDKYFTSTACLSCGECKFCLNDNENLCQNASFLGSSKIGSMGTYLKLDKKNLVEVPSKDSSVLFEVAAVGLRAIGMCVDIDNIKKGTDVLIFGAGPVGVWVGLCAQKLGLNPILVEMFDYRVSKAKELGLTCLSFMDFIIKKKTGYKYIVDATGNSGVNKGAFNSIFKYSGIDTSIVIVGKYKGTLNLPSDMLSRRDISVRWMAGIKKNDIIDAVTMFETEMDDIYTQMKTHEFDLNNDSLENAFDLSRNKQCMKIIINS